MKCPYCKYTESKVIDSRPTVDGESIRRRRICQQCGKRFTTYETIESRSLMVIKKDGSRQQYDREKLMRGIIKACQKRPVTKAQMDDLLSNIEKELYDQQEDEVSSMTIGEMVVERLIDIDEVAYIRFASVYRDFDDVDSFMAELKRIRPHHK
ncbi:transcriptional regulator NrdR [Butyricicoccus intestinisimiae]|jgi:transcriptional repressor NrdR|uniref:transcriptional regulator NrdR n=1 Tax=Butyricicoccus intestinisimiae TaxID=2841509 RepID=UPI003D8EB390